jgi:protein SCO1/2
MSLTTRGIQIFNPAQRSFCARVSCFLLLLGLCGCASNPDAKSSLPPCCQHRLAAKEAALTDDESQAQPWDAKSVYDNDSAWQTDDGKTIKLADLKGRVRIISMFYVQCSGICTVTRDDLLQIEASLSRAARERVGFVFVTFDPAEDSIHDLRQYRSEQTLSRDRWTLLRGDKPGTFKLISSLGIGVRRDSNGRFIHSSDIIVLDENGRILHHYNGLHADLASITHDIEKLVGSNTASAEKIPGGGA